MVANLAFTKRKMHGSTLLHAHGQTMSLMFARDFKNMAVTSLCGWFSVRRIKKKNRFIAKTPSPKPPPNQWGFLCFNLFMFFSSLLFSALIFCFFCSSVSHTSSTLEATHTVRLPAIISNVRVKNNLLKSLRCFLGLHAGRRIENTSQHRLPRGPKDQKNSRFRSGLKTSSENEIFERATHRGPFFVGKSRRRD